MSFEYHYQSLPLSVIVTGNDIKQIKYVNQQARSEFLIDLEYSKQLNDFLCSNSKNEYLAFKHILETQGSVDAYRLTLNDTSEVLITGSRVGDDYVLYVRKVFHNSTYDDIPERESVYHEVRDIILQAFISDMETDRIVASILKICSLRLDLNRVYLFELISSEQMKCTAEYITGTDYSNVQNLEVIHISQIDKFNRVSRGIPKYITGYEKKRLEGDEDIRPNDVKAYVHMPLIVRGKNVGIVGFDDCQNRREWTQTERRIIMYASNILAELVAKKQLENEIKITNKTLSTVLDNTAAITYVVDCETHDILFFSKSLRESYPGVSLKGKKCWEVLRPDFGGKQCEICENYKLDGQPAGTTHSHDVYNSLIERWFFVNETVLDWSDGKKAILMSCLDITDRKQTEIALEEKNSALLLAQKDLHTAEEMLEKDRLLRRAIEQSRLDAQNIVDTVPSPVLIVTQDDFLIEYANRSFLDMFEKESLEEIKGLCSDEFMPEYQPNGERSRKEKERYISIATETGEDIEYEFVYSLGEGKDIEVKVMASRIIYNEKRVFLAILQDMRKEKKREQLLLRAAEKEREANQLKSNFLANMSHEIRTPMNAILGFSSLAMRGANMPQEVETYKKIKNAANSLLNIFNDILDFSKIEKDGFEIINSTFVLENLLNDSLETAEKKIKDRDVSFKVQVEEGVPKVLIGDRGRLEQILKNILDNAVKYTKEGSIELRVVWKKQKSDDKEVFIGFIIKDTGIGMSESNLNQLFVRFTKFGNDYQVGGTGLGMSIVKQLVDRMGGAITVTSEEGIGTEVVFELPFIVGDINSKEEANEMEYETFPGARVLLVEDNPINQEVADGVLSMFDLKADIAENGQECLEMLEKKEYDLVFMDIMMPVMDGYTATHMIRESGKTYGNVPIVAMTANVLQEQKDKCFEEGMDGHVGKPLDISQIYNYLIKFLK